MGSRMNYYYYNYNYNGTGSSSRLLIKDEMSPPPPPKPQRTTTKQDETSSKMMRQVQVVYYLSRNGQLEHPHFMELSLACPYLRLKDVLERLTALRGKDMPALYSWSCKRSYKHGYVWNDLAHNDIIYPTHHAPDEYVLKGSQLPEKRTRAEEAVEEDENSSYNSFSSNANTPPPSRCSVGISTDDIQQLTLTPSEDYSPPPLSTSSSSSSDKLIEPSRNSVLLQLVACGGSNRCGQRPKQVVDKEVCKTKSPVKKNEEEDVAMIKCMSENPRFGGFQTENKEYFSGSIVEAVAAEERVAVEPSGLKRSNSFNEER